MDLQTAVRAWVAGLDFVFFAVKMSVKKIKQGQQDGAADQYGHQHMAYRPHEIHAFQKAEEQRRVAQWGQAAADVGYQENKENDGVYAVFAVIVGLQQRAYHQHRRAGCPHHGSQQGADGEDGGIRFGRAMQVAPYQNASGHGIECQQQCDKGNVFVH